MTNLNTVALLMRDDIVTVNCSFNGEDGKEYTYICEKCLAEELALGDKVVVMGNKLRLQIVEVRQIDEDCDVDINSSWEYAWIIQRISLETYEFNEAENVRIVNQLKKQQRDAARKQALSALGIDESSKSIEHTGAQ